MPEKSRPSRNFPFGNEDNISRDRKEEGCLPCLGKDSAKLTALKHSMLAVCQPASHDQTRKNSQLAQKTVIFGVSCKNKCSG